MATTRLIPLHVGEGRSAGTAIRDIIEYVENPDKTDGFQLVTGYQCDSRSVERPFEREDGAMIYGYCFKDAKTNYSPNMGKGYPMFLPPDAGGACKSYMRDKESKR